MGITRVRPGASVKLHRIDPRGTGGLKEDEAKRKLEKDLDELADLHDCVYAAGNHAVLIVLQGMDTSGKDGTVKHVMRALNPVGCNVVPFKVPTEEEAAHDFLWRIHRAVPRHRQVTIFNRSHYEDVIVPFVHRTLPHRVIEERYERINEFERLLVDSHTLVLKFFLHISKHEQHERLVERLKDPTKRWKFSAGDWKERELWPRYMRAYEHLLRRCSTRSAPWWVVPADHKWYRNFAVASTLIDALRGLHCRYPEPPIPPALRRRVGL